MKHVGGTIVPTGSQPGTFDFEAIAHEQLLVLGTVMRAAPRLGLGTRRAVRIAMVEEYVVVLEYHVRATREAIGYTALHAIVEELRDWHPVALFSPDRYALQLHVVAQRPTEALRRGLALHDRAVSTLEMRPPDIARVEVLTDGELERQWDGTDESALPKLGGSVLSNELYWATRGLLRAMSASELTEVLVNFVTAVGAQVQPTSTELPPGHVAIDLSLEAEEGRCAVVDPISVSGLILEYSLPTLVADARAALARRHQHYHVADEAGRTGSNGCGA